PLLAVARDAAAAAVGVHRTHVGHVDIEQWTEKGTSDFVTHVDHEAEAEIVSRIRSAFPDHAILAEEAASMEPRTDTAVGGSGWTWIVDPLDGTTNFLHSYPMYGVSIAASFNGVLQVGLVQNSVTDELWHATRNGGAFRNGRPIQVSGMEALRRSLIGTGFPFKALDLLPRYLVQFDRVLRNSSGIRRAGSAALDLCHVATGFFDGFWELALQPWDIAAGTLIVREAGGIVTTIDGDENVVKTGSVLAGNAAIHEALAALLRGETTCER
ncbi:MAG: inositol monophosphatase family protein, partial [Longimicrobiales bacterium]